ncbi:hypothetical protein A9Q84_13980 [Halobacteriovorax marinus]|uniref:Globin domain-containing protein n=1 Tax=Halobacteriovorax marinus TaxID=97084 RepID=A0A1Y5FEW2_9BACT|nr:hypothetical protein A9Q84_13980 [Halobacteriovorax marinus]
MDIKRDFFLENIDQFVESFYEHFFSLTPEIFELFKNSEIGKQKNEFKISIHTLLINLSQLDKLDSYFKDLGIRHICYNVSERHYKLAKESFLYAIKKTYADHWSKVVETKWEEIIDHVTLKMKEGVKSFELAY